MSKTKKKYRKPVGGKLPNVPVTAPATTPTPQVVAERVREQITNAYNDVVDRWIYKELNSIGTGKIGRRLGRRRSDLFWRGWKRVLLQDRVSLSPGLVKKIEEILRTEPDRPGPFTRFVREHILPTSMGKLEGFQFNLEPICVCLDLLLDHMTPDESEEVNQ